MPTTAPIICLPPSAHVPVITATPVATGGGTTVSQTINDIAFLITTTDSGALSYAIDQSVPQFGKNWALTSETPAICSVSGNQVLKISSGKGVIRASGSNGFSKILTLDFTATTTTSEVWTGMVAGSQSAKLSDPILSLLVAGKNKNYYATTYPLSSAPVAGANFPKNSNCWAAGIDITGSMIATGLGGNVRASNSGALVTPQHSVGVKHFGSGPENMGPGQKGFFVDATGIIYERTVVQRYIHPTKDLIMILWNAPLPAGVKPFKLAGASMRDSITRRFYGMGWQISQEKNVSPVSFDATHLDYYPLNNPLDISWRASWLRMSDPSHRLFGLESLLQNARTGDSGGAIGGFYNGETYLVSLFTGPNYGNLYGLDQATELNSIIASIDAAAGISTGYAVGVLESGFDPLSLSPAMWLDASDASTLYDATSGGAVVAPDGGVARWQDKSGNALHATQATTGYRPLRKSGMLNGKSVLRFDGVDDSFVHALNIVGDNTVFVVLKSLQTSYTDIKEIFSATAPNTSRNGLLREWTSSQWGTDRNEGFKTSGQSVKSGYKIISVQSVGTNGNFTHNGAASSFTSSQFTFDAAGMQCIGGLAAPSSRNYNADIAEILVFPTALSSTDRAKVETYLNSKWAIY
jgi:hypothetical protein